MECNVITPFILSTDEPRHQPGVRQSSLVLNKSSFLGIAIKSFNFQGFSRDHHWKITFLSQGRYSYVSTLGVQESITGLALWMNPSEWPCVSLFTLNIAGSATLIWYYWRSVFTTVQGLHGSWGNMRYVSTSQIGSWCERERMWKIATNKLGQNNEFVRSFHLQQVLYPGQGHGVDLELEYTPDETPVHRRTPCTLA